MSPTSYQTAPPRGVVEMLAAPSGDVPAGRESVRVLGMRSRVGVQEILSLHRGQERTRRLRRIAQDEGSAVLGESSPRLEQHLEAGRVHERDLRQVQDDVLPGAEVRL